MFEEVAGTGSLHASVIFDEWAHDSPVSLDFAAKCLLRYVSNCWRLLPGAALIASSGGGVANIYQNPSSFLAENFEGHIVWMEKYSFWEVFWVLVAILVSSALAWDFDTGTPNNSTSYRSVS